MHNPATICLVVAVICEVIAAVPPWTGGVNWMPLGFAFGFLSLVIGNL